MESIEFHEGGGEIQSIKGGVFFWEVNIICYHELHYGSILKPKTRMNETH